MRERGLKHAHNGANKEQIEVAPHAGAWIETYSRVVPYCIAKPSLPMRERGLKPVLTLCINYVKYVAPHAGAWIETIHLSAIILPIVASLPMRERGLKLLICPSFLFYTRRSPCGSVD